MRKINLYFGLVLFVTFLMSGVYMQEYFKPENIANLALRMEVRANHIYMLLISLLNVIAFKCEVTTGKKLTYFLEPTFRVLLLAAGVTGVLAFLFDHDGTLTGRYITLTTVVFSLSSVVVFLMNEVVYFYRKN